MEYGYLFKLLIIYQWVVFSKASPEYFTNNTDSANYLETFFDDTDGHMFPSNLKISFLLSSNNDGLLFYSIDRNSNQLIVTIRHSVDITMKIQFNGETKVLSVKELCICTICLHKKLNFQFCIKNNLITIKCNENRPYEISSSPRKTLNEKYPIPTFGMNNKISAYLWIINTPVYKNRDSYVYPNNGHLSGRFFDITYRDMPLNLSIVGSSGRCNNLCTDDLCNGGKCLETFQCKPVCDCTETFLNGDFCNSNISSYGVLNTSISWKSLKMSWTGSIGDIFKISNKNITFSISFVSSTSLEFVIESNFTSKIQFPGNYSAKDKFIFLITSENKFIEIRVTSGMKQWYSFPFFIYRDLMLEHFSEIKFINDSSGDIVYKPFADHWKWYPIKGLISFKPFQNSSLNESSFAYLGGIIFLVITNVITVVLSVVIYRRNKRSKLTSRHFADENKSNYLFELIPNKTSDKSAIEENGPSNINGSDIANVNADILNTPHKTYEKVDKVIT